MQTWEINGRKYTHGQLMDLRARGLDPRKGKIEMRMVEPDEAGDESGGKLEALSVEVEVLKELNDSLREANEDLQEENEDLKGKIEELLHNQEPSPSNDEVSFDEMPFQELKKLAEEKGMAVSNTTTKAEALEYLNNLTS